MSRWPLLLLVLLTCALGLAACGGDDSSGNDDDDDVAKILSETFGEGKEVKSGRLDLAFRLNAKGVPNLNGPLGLRLTGPFQSTKPTELPRFDFDATVDVSGQQIRAGAVSTADKGFLTFQDQAYAVSDELFKQFKDGYAEQAKCTAEQGKENDGVSFSSLGVRPATWLRDAKKAGEEKVGGADTTHITGSIDVPKFLDDVNRILGRTNPQQEDPCADQADGAQAKPPAGSRQLTEAQRKQIAEAVKTAKVEIWTGAEDRTMRRINVVLSFDVPEGQRQQLNGLSTGDIRFDMTIGALNEPQTIKGPANAKPLDDLIAQFGGQVPGLGGGGQNGGSGGAQEGASGGGSSKYQRCLEEAGSDVTKLQQCSDLVGQ